LRVVVTGREGQVVQSLIERASKSVEIVPIGRPELDLSADVNSIVSVLMSAQPDVIVSAAAYTHVDKAESEPHVAFAVNEQGARAVAIAARECDVPLIHLSTDYVFDGTKASPYVEDDETGPTTVYGASKLAGELAVLAEHENSAILRTAWIYSPYGVNFVKTMLRLGEARNEIGVVADQRGNPTSALDIADGVLAVASNLRGGENANLRGVFHMAATGDASWAEFASAIFCASAHSGGPEARVKHISTADFATAVTRPANSQLDSTKLARTHGVRLPGWTDSLGHVVSRVLELRTRAGATT